MNRRVLAVVVAVVLAFVGTAAVAAYVRGADRRAVEGQETVDVFVTAKDLPAGTTAQRAVDDGLMVQETIAKKGVPDDALTEVGPDNAELVATSDITAGEIVLASKFSTEAATPGVVALPAGQMAVSVELSDPARVGTFLQVGSDIAIFDTFNVLETYTADRIPAGDHLQDRHEYTRATRLLLPRVKVLGIGATTTTSSNGQDTTKSNEQVSTALVTLAVTQAQAEKLIHGIQTGTLYFALLNSQSDVKPGKGVDDRQLFSP
jgi:pilus assembly protein CpaB